MEDQASKVQRQEPKGAKLSNIWPKTVQQVVQEDQALGHEKVFSEALDYFLTRVPDEPRAPGMTPGVMTEDSRMTNSLLWQVDRARREGILTTA